MLLASPEAAASEWVQREVQWWRDNRSEDGHIRRFVVVRTAGTVEWAESDVDWEVTDALPARALTGAFPAELLRAELPRRAGSAVPYLRLLPAALGAVLRGRRARALDPAGVSVLRSCVEDVAAAVRETDKDLLTGDHRREHRRTRWTAGLTAALVAALLATLLVAWQQTAASRNRAAAADLVRRAEIARQVDPALALRLGIAADDLAPSSRTRAGLTQTLAGTRYRGALDGAAPTFAYTGPPRSLTVDDRAVRLWDVTAPSRARQTAALTTLGGGSPVAASFSPGATTVAVAGASGAVRLWDVGGRPRGVVPTQRRQEPGSIVPASVSLAFTPDGAFLAVSTGDADPSLWDVRDPDGPRLVAPLPAGNDVNDLAISPDGRLLVAGDAAGTTTLWDISTPTSPRVTRWSTTGHGPVSDLAFSSGGLLGVAGPDDQAQVWAVDVGAAPRRVAWATNPQGMTSIAFSPSRPLLATGGRTGAVDLWDVSEPGMLRRSGPGIQTAAATMAFSGDGLLATAGDRGGTTLWTVDDPRVPVVVGPAFDSGKRG